MVFEEDGRETMESEEFQEFFSFSKEWLVPYALFQVLANIYTTPDHTQWDPAHQNMTTESIVKLSSEKIDECEYYYYVQYHLHSQLMEASEYAAFNHVGLMVDLPIGVHPSSVDCWLNPNYFNMDMSAGDPALYEYNNNGEVWGVPTYNWEEMKKQSYSWWKSRLAKLSLYFQAYRIKHINGIARMWEIPLTHDDALLGHYSPSTPITRTELELVGLWDIDRLTNPYITEDILRGHFGTRTPEIISTYFNKLPTGLYIFKDQYQTKTKIQASKPIIKEMDLNKLKGVFSELMREVILIPDPSDPKCKFYPRVKLYNTRSYHNLPDWMKETLWKTHQKFYFEKQDVLWERTADERLSMLKSSSEMLMVGEEASITPNCIALATSKSKILMEKSQRVTLNENQKFVHPSEYPYLSLCTTSSLDSPTISEWWKEHPVQAKMYYNLIMREKGNPPVTCDTPLLTKIIEQHMWSPSLWASFPLKDLLALKSEFRKEEMGGEVGEGWPAMDIKIEEFINNQNFINHLESLITACGRR
eukprot:TRINITY_DN4040_c0_g1_i1.p1 TRINITY_DN4040_c0_g1~~TRINITY_DN4040_c0_g1_i1.p1  ORF type:complete len:531 (-),score=139.25 TRINITY_DN4040_c0_g1_i1:21-1613(-)